MTGLEGGTRNRAAQQTLLNGGTKRTDKHGSNVPICNISRKPYGNKFEFGGSLRDCGETQNPGDDVQSNVWQNNKVPVYVSI